MMRHYLTMEAAQLRAAERRIAHEQQMRNDPDFHEGQAVYRTNATHALILCPAGHLVSSYDLKNWAGSAIEASWGQPRIVQCIGALPRTS